MLKIVVYTALFGDYDELPEPGEKYKNCDFVCFTDQKKISSNIWQIIYVERTNESATMMNRKYKLLPHKFLKNYDISLYIDANIILKKNPYALVIDYLDRNVFLMPKHSHRNCLYDEAKVCVGQKKSSLKRTVKQMKIYRKEGFPKKYGLGENNILLRKHNDKKVIKLMEFWYNELLNRTQRDQLSLGFSLWKNDMVFSYINENSRILNDYFTYKPHKNNHAVVSVFSKLSSSIRFRLLKFLYLLYDKVL